MFTYLVLTTIWQRTFSFEKTLIICTSYALRNGLFALFRTVSCTDVHLNCTPGSGQGNDP